MPQYQFTVVHADGSRKKMNLEAPSVERLKSIISSSGDIAVNIREAGVLNKEIEIGGKIKAKDLAVFCEQMQSILKAGVSAVDAMKMVGNSTQNKKLKSRIELVTEKVRSGQSMSTAMSVYDDVFPLIMIQMIRAGEESGSLDEIMGRLALQFTKSSQLQSSIKKSLAYPKMIITVVVLALVVVCAYVVPMFVDIFEDLGTELPVTTKMFIALSNLFTNYWWLLIILVIVTVTFWLVFKNSEYGFRIICSVKLKIPLFADLERKTASANFARTLSTLLKSGMDYPKSLDIACSTMSNIFFKEAVEGIRGSVLNGMTLTDGLKKSAMFPELLENLLQIGENTGNIPQMLENSAIYFEDEVETATVALTSAIQPIIMIVMGVFVGMLVYSIYTPMFSMYSSIG